jgi:lipopolysaccharide biosynthesis protein
LKQSRSLETFGNVCIFAHFNPTGKLLRHVITYILELRASGYDVFLVSNSSIDSTSLSELSGLCALIVQRINIGFDFGAWAAIVRNHGNQIRGNLILANDSVIAPVGNLSTLIRRIEIISADFSGVVKSYEFQPHLQSWFLFFRPAVHRSREFLKFFMDDFDIMSKEEVILKGEIKLSTGLAEAGFIMGAVYDPKKYHPLLEIAQINPMHWDWYNIVIDYKIPFIKRDLIERNPSNIWSIKNARKQKQLLQAADQNTDAIEYMRLCIISIDNQYSEYPENRTLVNLMHNLLSEVNRNGTLYYVICFLAIAAMKTKRLVRKALAPSART